MSFARNTWACSLFNDEGDIARVVDAAATEGVMTLGTGVCDCASGDAAWEGRRNESNLRFMTGFAGPGAGEGVAGALSSAVVGLRNVELRLDAPLVPTSVNMKRFSPPAWRSLPLWLVFCVLRRPPRSSRIRRSSLASSKACIVPKRSRATSSTDRFSSSTVS